MGTGEERGEMGCVWVCVCDFKGVVERRVGEGSLEMVPCEAQL